MAISQIFHNFMTLIVPMKCFIECSSICICLMFSFFRSPIISFCWSIVALGFLGGSVVKNPPANLGDAGLIPWVKKISWRRKWQPTPVFLPGKSNGQRSLMGYSPCKELGTVEPLSTHILLKLLIDSQYQISKVTMRTSLGVEWVKTLDLHCRGPEFEPWLGN